MKRENLYVLRGERSRPEVAQEIGITPQMLGAIERGDRNPSLNLAKKIADFYKVSVDVVFFGSKGNETFPKGRKKKGVS